MDGCKNGYVTGLCRFCANDRPGIQIFSELGLEQRLYVKIQQCQFPFKVTMNDKLPKFICFTCIKKLNVFDEFYHSAIAMQSKLEGLSLSRGPQKENNILPESQSNDKLTGEPEMRSSSPQIFTIDLMDEDEEPVRPKKPYLENKVDCSSGGRTNTSTPPIKISGSSASQRTLSSYSNPSSSFKVPSPTNQSSVNQMPIHIRLAPPRGNTHVINGVSMTRISNSKTSEENMSDCSLVGNTRTTPIKNPGSCASQVALSSSSSLRKEGKINGPLILGTIDITGPKETDDVLTIDITGPDEANHKILEVFSLAEGPPLQQSQHPNTHFQQKKALRS